tara:strand:- start:106331 stop:108586 length:2256 start_codon:yes stop_codon:yes gene_type:complete
MQIFRSLVLSCVTMYLPATTAWSQVDAKNLIGNPSFEFGTDQGPTGWKASSWKACSGNWDDEHAFDGNRSVKLAGLNGGWATSCTVAADTLHRFTIRYRLTGGPSRIVAYVRENGKSEPILYHGTKAIEASDTSSFIDGQFVEKADENGWVLFDAGLFTPRIGLTNVDVLIKLVSEDPTATVWLDDIRITALQPETVPETSAQLARVEGATIWTDNENRKIFLRQTPPNASSTNKISLDLARGEYGSFQIAVTPEQPWTGVEFRTSALDGLETFPADHLRCRRLEYIAVDNPIKPFARAGLHPDPLSQRIPCEIAAHTNQVFWFTVHVPDTQPSGNYNGHVSLHRKQQDETIHVCDVSLSIRVRDFALPRRPSMDTFARMHLNEVLQLESGTKDDIVNRYFRSYFEHRVRCSLAASVGVRLKGDAAIVNSAAFVDQLKFVRKTFGARPFFVPALWIAHDKHRMPTDASWKGRRIFSDDRMTRLHPGFEKPFTDFLRQLTATLKSENLFQDPIIRFIDEPVLEDDATRSGISAIARLIKEVAPEISISLTTTSPHAELSDVIDQWVLHTDAWDRSSPQIESARRAGASISVYNNAIAYVEQERIRIRLWPWLLKKYDVQGSYSWCGTTAWRGEMVDPWNCGKSYFEVMFYPPRDAQEQGPIESVRWELFRQGLQDYEYICLAERLAAQLEQQGDTNAAQKGRDAVAGALMLVDHWPRVRPANDRPYVRDVTRLAQARRKLAEAIESMQAASR